MQRLVLDTNVWIDWLVFDDSAVAPVRAAVASGQAEVWYDPAGETELAEVLGRKLGRRQLTAEEQNACLAQLRAVARRNDGAGAGAGTLPRCSDPDDQKFLELARDCGAGLLLTRDQALLDLGRRAGKQLSFRIAAPRELAGALS